MRVLVIGDIIGDSGLNKLREVLPNFKKAENIDFVIVNGENSADGLGITSKEFNEILRVGVDIVTLGNHTWAKKDIFSFIENEKIIRPANYSKNLPGKGYRICECNDKRIAVINLIGRVDMQVLSENPFTVAEELIENIKKEVDIIIVDFHAEATAEKIAMAYFLDGKISFIFGTHTHVQTADEIILEKGTGYITDIGMTGPRKSIIGMDVDAALKRFLTSLPERYKVSNFESSFNGCIFDINDETNRTEKITRVIK